MIQSVMIKPVGDLCNLRCAYCYYRKVSPASSTGQMLSLELVERMFAGWLPKGPQKINISFQGGEPTLVGLQWFEGLFNILNRYRRTDQQITLALQTNGLQLDGDWAKLLSSHGVLVGLSIDGPEPLHDHYRRDAQGKGSFKKVLRAARLLIHEGVQVNAIVLLNDRNVSDPLGLYGFLKRQGFQWMQFIPCVEWTDKSTLKPFSITSEAYGKFLIDLFEAWYPKDVGRIFVRYFESLLLKLAGLPGGLCYLESHCHPGLTVEHEGSVYGCDHFVTEKWYLGSIDDPQWVHWDTHPRYVQFAKQKAQLPDSCASCSFVRICGGGCQKHRDPKTCRNIFCSAYKRFFGVSLLRLQNLVGRLQT
jgi:uncharacterized protein